MGFATNAIHVGQEPDPTTGAVTAPIYQTSTYVYEELGKTEGRLRLRADKSPEPQGAGTHGGETGRRAQRVRVHDGDGGD